MSTTTATTTSKRAPKQPQDHKPKTPQIDDVEDRDITFEYDGESFTVNSADVKGLEFLAALEDEDYIVAMRLVLGRDDAARFFKGRKLEDIGGFFDALGEVVDAGNR